MKFVLAALSAFFLAAEAKRNVRVNHEMLMKNAVKVTDPNILAKRKLWGGSNFQVTADHSIQFDSCIAVATQPADNDVFYSENNIAYAKSGQIKSQKSFVTFNVCETKNCRYQGNDNLYMIDLDSYVSSTMGFYPTHKAMYCNTCQRSADYCIDSKKKAFFGNSYQQQAQDYDAQYQDGGNQYQYANGANQYQQANNANQYQQANNANQYQQANDANQYQQANAYNQQYDGGNYDQNNGGRNLQNYGWSSSSSSSNPPDNVITVTCDQCESDQCFDEDYYEAVSQMEYQSKNYNYNDQQQDYDGQQQNYNGQQQQNQQIDSNDLAEWITELAGCTQIDAEFNGEALYAGLICNAEGTGVEIGLFLDDMCSIYTSVMSYKDAITGNYYYQNNNGDDYNNGNNYYNNNNNANYEDLAYLSAAQDIVTYPFTHDIDCSASLAYATPWGSYKMNNYYSQGKANQWCTYLFQGKSTKLDDCNSDGVEDSGYNYNVQQQQDYYYYNANQDGNANYNNYQNQQNYDNYDNAEEQQAQQYYYSFYDYVLSQQDLYDGYKTCSTIRSLDGEYTPVFDKNAATVFDYSKRENAYKNRGFFEGPNRGLKAVGLVIIILALLAAAIGFLKDYCTWKQIDPKEEKLVIEDEKIYAREIE